MVRWYGGTVGPWAFPRRLNTSTNIWYGTAARWASLGFSCLLLYGTVVYDGTVWWYGARVGILRNLYFCLYSCLSSCLLLYSLVRSSGAVVRWYSHGGHPWLSLFPYVLLHVNLVSYTWYVVRQTNGILWFGGTVRLYGTVVWYGCTVRLYGTTVQYGGMGRHPLRSGYPFLLVHYSGKVVRRVVYGTVVQCNIAAQQHSQPMYCTQHVIPEVSLVCVSPVFWYSPATSHRA